MSPFHYFDIDDAKKYGVETAAILQQFKQLIDYNQKLDKQLYDGEHWINISDEDFKRLFPYIDFGKVKRIIFKLVEIGVLKRGYYQSSKYDKSHWFAFNHQVSVTPEENQPNAPQKEPITNNINEAPAVVAKASLADPQPKESFGWSNIMVFAIEEQVAKLIAQHGYDQGFYHNIWNAFAAKMDADGEKVPTMDFVRKRFMAYAQATMVNFKQGNYRYNANVQRNDDTKQRMIEKWRKYLGNPDNKLINSLDTKGLQTPIAQVWDAYINKNYQNDVPLKNVTQLEAGFKNYLASWIRNESPQPSSNVRYTSASSSKVNFDDTSWADDIDLGD